MPKVACLCCTEWRERRRNERATRPSHTQLNKSFLSGALAGGISMKAKNLNLAASNPTKTEYAIIFAVVIIFAFATYEPFGG